MRESFRAALIPRRSKRASRSVPPCGRPEPPFAKLFSEREKRAIEWAHTAIQLSNDREVEYGVALASVLAGDSAKAGAIADEMEKRFSEDSSVKFNYLPTIRAILALNRAEAKNSLETLQVATPHELGIPASAVSGLFGALYPVYFRGQAYLAAKEPAKAALEFQKIIDHRGIVVSDPIGAMAPLQLERAYASSGELTKARSEYHDFLVLWKDADRDIPVLRQAEAEYARLQQTQPLVAGSGY